MEDSGYSEYEEIHGYLISRIQILGQGTFARVLKGVRRSDQMDVAVKKFNYLGIESESIERLKSIISAEIGTLKKVSNSRHIVTLYDYIDQEMYCYIILEFCNGGNLATLLKSKGILTEPEMRVYFLQIIDGMKAIHSCSIIHRDLKPENILLNENEIRIADFGVAKFFGSASENHNSFLGSPLYMAPEVLRLKNGFSVYNSNCDVYSVGVIIVELLSGDHPNNFADLNEIYTYIVNTVISVENISRSLSNLLTQMLEKEMSKRAFWPQVFEHPYLRENWSFDSENEDNKPKGKTINGIVEKKKIEIDPAINEISSFYNFHLRDCLLDKVFHDITRWADDEFLENYLISNLSRTGMILGKAILINLNFLKNSLSGEDKPVGFDSITEEQWIKFKEQTKLISNYLIDIQAKSREIQGKLNDFIDSYIIGFEADTQESLRELLAGDGSNPFSSIYTSYIISFISKLSELSSNPPPKILETLASLALLKDFNRYQMTLRSLVGRLTRIGSNLESTLEKHLVERIEKFRIKLINNK